MLFHISFFFGIHFLGLCLPVCFHVCKEKKVCCFVDFDFVYSKNKTRKKNRVASPSRHFSSSTAAFSISFLILVLTLVLLFFFSLCSQTEMTFKWFSTEMHSNFIAAAYWFSLHLPLFLLHKQYHCVEFRERKKRSFLSLFFWPFRLLLWFSACARSCAFRHFNSCSLLK